MKNYTPKLVYEDVTHEYITKRKLQAPGLEPLVYDEEAFSHTDIGIRGDELVSFFNVYRDAPMHPNVLRYWARSGLKKELFDNEGKFGFEAEHEYSVFTPIDMDPDKKYALIYFCHGGGQPMEWAEVYGFNTLAAAEKYIVVYAQNGGRSNDEAEKEFGRIMGEIRKKGYPVDWERVYAAGFSSGAEACGRIACAYPETVAAVAGLPDGIPFRALPFHKGPEVYASTKGYRIPGVFIGGTFDKGCFPSPWITEYFGSEINVVGSIKNAVEALDVWMRDIGQIARYVPLTYEGVIGMLKDAEDPFEKEFALKFEQTYTFRAQGTDWFGGEFYGNDGAPVMRWVRAYGVPHMAWESAANIAWDYLKHFRRDQATGESIYDPVVCWGER